mmetsp:Transcript_28125/g.86216  ORF Transcript_28125/g.86216 Transcript_28125/m.86216 type:complete len:314 (+) Transcript_28125:56-997(+)
MNAGAEAHLSSVAARGQETVVSMVRQLSGAVMYPEAGNVRTNEKLWDVYATEWDPSKEWVQSMARGSGLSESPRVVGDEWAPADHTRRVLDEWLLSIVTDGTKSACEIGCGGGRVARVLLAKAPSLERFTLFDVSKQMLARARASLKDVLALQKQTVVEFVHVDGDGDDADPDSFADSTPRKYATRHRASYDLVVCFDVMVHMDLHTVFKCLRRIRALLKPGGVAFVSTANLLAPDGWARFEVQSRATVGGFYFTTPDAVRLLVAKAGLAVLRESQPDPSNTYYNRDLLLVLGRSFEDDDANDGDGGKSTSSS